MNVSVSLENLTGRALSGLRVEFSDRYWPWIAGPADQAKASIVVLNPAATVPANGVFNFRRTVAVRGSEASAPINMASWSGPCAEAGAGHCLQPAGVCDSSGIHGAAALPGAYVYPDLKNVNVKSYRHFYPEGADTGAISFDHDHTMFPSEGAATINYRVSDPGPDAWHGVRIEERLLKGNQVLTQSVAKQNVELESASKDQSRSLPIESQLKLPAEQGIYQLEVRVVAGSGDVLAQNDLELGVNPLAKSLLFFCAHEDDDGTQMGFIRALVENHVPFHMVYFTSGDAGSCDRYFQHSCGPAEALNFGAIRMQEARAAMGHLGVPPENILFLGLPDGGSGKIWYDHRASSDPYLAVLLASDHAPYEGLFLAQSSLRARCRGERRGRDHQEISAGGHLHVASAGGRPHRSHREQLLRGEGAAGTGAAGAAPAG